MVGLICQGNKTCGKSDLIPGIFLKNITQKLIILALTPIYRWLGSYLPR